MFGWMWYVLGGRADELIVLAGGGEHADGLVFVYVCMS
jgi:hypothetical protein